jgi:DNA-binding NarL/FixJ family response regulator
MTDLAAGAERTANRAGFCLAHEDGAALRRVATLAERAGYARVSPATAAVALYCCTDFRSADAERVRQLTRDVPERGVLVVSAFDHVAQVRCAVEAGASGLIAERDAHATLAVAIAAVAAGLLALPGAYRARVARPVFTTREKEILGLVIMGLSNGEIGRRLYLAESTVKSHLSSAFTKLGVRSRNEATALILDPASGLGPGIVRVTPKPLSLSR